jgi:hypothetical protein
MAHPSAKKCVNLQPKYHPDEAEKIPTFHADFPGFTLKIVEHSRYLLLNLQQWAGSVYTWLTHPLLDPQKSGRVLMDPLMKLVVIGLNVRRNQPQ